MGVDPVQDTPEVERCATPGCNRSLWFVRNGRRFEDRFGVLCSRCAVDVAAEVLESKKAGNRFRALINQMDSDRLAQRLEIGRLERESEAKTAELQRGRDGFVYYLRVGERIKVGFSVDVKRRMRAYPPGSQLLAVEPGDLNLERERHHQFASSRTDGREWFRPTSDLMEHVQALVAEHGEPKRFAHHYRRNEAPMRLRRSA